MMDIEYKANVTLTGKRPREFWTFHGPLSEQSILVSATA